MGTVEEYRKRREQRLIARGLNPVDYRMDAPEGETNNNQSSGGKKGGGGGNTRLPFGLCMRYGIAIEPGWGPGDAWEALKSKGISSGSAYKKLKAGADPGTPESPPPPKREPVRSFKPGGRWKDAEIEKLMGRKLSWVGRGKDPWELSGTVKEGTGEGIPSWRSRMRESFHTKTDMLHWLKDKGIEEFADPETGEVINPAEMDLPKAVMKIGKTGYSDVSIGMRDGMYSIIGTDFDGKKKKIDEFFSLKDAKGRLEALGVAEGDVKMSPALKKREKERLSWLGSDKKEYFEEGGKKYGDIRVEETWDNAWYITGEAEDGEKFGKRFESKAEMMKYFKDNGVEVVREGKKELNPMEYEVPPTKMTISGRPYQDVGIDTSGMAEVWLYGIDLDGRRKNIARKRADETLGEFKERIQSSWGVSEDQCTISDETRAKMEEITRAEEEKERRRKEFESKAVELKGTGRKYADIEIEESPYYSEYKIVGYDKDGRKRDITPYDGDFHDMEETAEKYGLDINSIIKDDEIRKEYEDYRKKVDEFESRAVDFAGDKYADVSVEWDRWDGYTLYGTDFHGRKREIGSAENYEDFEKLVSQYGHSPDSFPFDDESKERREKAMKAREALATGEYYSLGKKDSAFKDVRVEEDPDVSGSWRVVGTDIDGDESIVYSLDSWDEAITKMSELGVTDYKMRDKDGSEIGKPTWGMHKIMLMKKPGGGFVVFADSKRYGDHAVMYETPFENEAREWLKKNNVPESAVKTRGMNPNDDVPRVHTAKSLEGFDTHRMDRFEKIDMLRDMDERTKQETAEMLTELFDKGEYRMRRKGHFEEIFDSHFKSLLETGTSSGSSYKPGRRETGVESFGHDYDIKAKDGEKYGYLGVEDDLEAFKDRTASGYGETIYKFKKDRIKDRTTYSFGDTLDAGRPLVGYAGDKPTIEGVSGYDARGWGGGMDKLREALGYYRKYKSGDMSYEEMLKKIHRSCQDGYIETHYHGDLTLADVDSITFPFTGGYRNKGIKETFEGMKPEKRKKVVQFLKDNGIKLQYVENEQMYDGYEWLKKRFGEDV